MAAGATGLWLAGHRRALAAWPASGTMEINPAISNLRVVGLLDPAMVPTAPSTMTFTAQNAAVDTARVAANLDAMAMALAQKCTADEAWRAIFRSGRPWASTVVAIKINGAEPKNMARIAIIDRLARVLAGFGVPAANIWIYETQGSAYSYSTYCSKTDATKVPAVVNTDGMGGKVDVPLPDGTTAPCAKLIADGTVDILINLPTNKGHSAFGGATLSLKNHFGTFLPNHFCPPSDAGNFCSNPDLAKFQSYVFNISKSDAIIGGNPPRQQLCIVDSLWVNKVENTGTPESMPCWLSMGTFGPAVDYLTIKKIREAVVGATHTASLVNQYMTQYGYTTADPQWIVVPPAGSPDAGTCTSDGTGGTSGRGGTGSGGRGGGGSTSSGGSSGSGGAVGHGGSGGAGGAGASASGGAGGGVTASGGPPSGGSTAHGGTTSSGGLAGGGGATASAASGSGGATTAATTTPGGGGKGCGCDLGAGRLRFGRSTTWLALGAVTAGPLRRLLLRRERGTELAPGEPSPSDSIVQPEEHKE